MYFLSLSFNRYKITRFIFSIFLIIGILNWTLAPQLVIFAEEEVSVPLETSVEVPTETPTEDSAETPIQDPAQTDTLADTPVEVNTGDAVASSDTINQANTNEINSEGGVVVVGDSLGDSSLDLREDAPIFTTASSTCDNCINNTGIENQNTATVTNEIIVSADSGDNTASSTATSTIITGDAYAGANVVNVVNTNIVDSRYMLLVFNNFGDWQGDLVFPNIDFFANFLSLFNPNCGCALDVNISNSNTGSVNNNINTSADSGNNIVNGNSSINTGDALVSSNTYNLVNTNIYNNSSFYLLVKIFGNWSGNIFNLPPGIAWQNTPEGIVLYSEDNDPFTRSSTLGNLNASSTNSANVTNNLTLNASTGNNNATGTNTLIQTGNAYAGANIANIVNTNIISSNWMTALVNIFGNWSGNISFGQPDLWIGTVASVDGKVEAGSSVTFTTTIKNNGDAMASNINILSMLQSSYFRFAQSYSVSNLHHIDSLSPGESIQFSYGGMTERYIPDGIPPVVIDTNVSSFETDGNMKDNTDRISFAISNNPGSIILPQTSLYTTYPSLLVTKTHNIKSSVGIDGIEMIPFEGEVDYKIVVKNHGGKAYEGILIDQLKDSTGKIINEQKWDLGEILENEEIIITYTTEFTVNTIAGIYTNEAWVEALGGDYSYNPELASRANSNIASDKVIVANQPVVFIPLEIDIIAGEVLGEFTKDVFILNEESDFTEFLGGFCSEEKENKQKNLGIIQTILLSLSFVLIMQKRKGIPINMMML